MIDIHCHALYGVDDGARDLEESADMLRHAKSQGIDGIIFTPHYRHGMFAYPKDKILANFETLKTQAKTIGVEVYLGCEYHVNSEMIEALQTGRCLTLAKGDFVLTEYSFETEYSYICVQTRKLLSYGYIPVVAHAERYACLLKKPKLCLELADLGAYIQLNADSILGIEGKAGERFCRKLLRNQWADFVASDAHGMKERTNHLGKCMEHVAKKYGGDYAEILFDSNSRKILDSNHI